MTAVVRRAVIPAVMEGSSVRVSSVIAASVATLAFATVAHAQATIDITQDGADVVAILSGDINTSGLTYQGYSYDTGNAVFASGALIYINGDGQLYSTYSGISGPASFGTGLGFYATSATGDTFVYNVSFLALPYNYVSGTALSATEVFAGQTLASMGLTPGVYDYTWGSGGTAGYFQVDIGQSVPEPPSLPVIAAGLAALAFVGRKKAFLF